MSHPLFSTSTQLIARAFPMPEYLTMPAAGVNISDYSIKHVFLAQGTGGVRLASHGKVDLPLGTVERGEIKDMELLIKLLTRIRDEHGYRYVHIALPEEHAYLFQIELPVGPKAEMEQMLEFRLKENVPLGADEAVFDYNTIRTTESTAVLNVSVYPLALYERYAEAFHAADLSLLSAEIEGQATARALLDPEHPLPTLILDVGRNEASLSISTRGVVTFTATLESGGDLFTRAIARGLNLSFQEAERLKRKYGFRDTPDNRDVFDKLTPILSEFKEAIRKHLMYWHMHTNIGGDAVEEVATVVLVGGNANVAGLAEYLSTELDLPVEVGNVWGKTFENYDHYLPEIPAQSSLEYATAIGLARRSLLRGR